MKTALGIVLTVLGGGIMLAGLGYALAELIGMYAGALSDPLGDHGAGSEPKAVSARMIRAVLIGAAGIPFFVVGSFMLKVMLMQAMFKARKAPPHAAPKR